MAAASALSGGDPGGFVMNGGMMVASGGDNTGGQLGGVAGLVPCADTVEVCELAELASVAGDGTDANPDGNQMRLDIVQLDACGEMRLRVSRVDGDALEPGTYDLRAGSCRAFAPIRTTEVLEQPENTLDFFPVEHLGALDEVKSFCVTKRNPLVDNEDRQAWWWSNKIRVNRKERCQAENGGQMNGGIHADLGGLPNINEPPMGGMRVEVDQGGQRQFGGQPEMGGMIEQILGGRPMLAQVCDGQSDGRLIRTGQWSACEGFSDICDEIGFRTRVNLRCMNGQLQPITERLACRRETENRRCSATGVCRDGRCFDIDAEPRCRARRIYPETSRRFTDGCNADRGHIHQARGDDPNGNQVNLSFKRCQVPGEAQPVAVNTGLQQPAPPMDDNLCVTEPDQMCDGCCRSSGQWPVERQTLEVLGVRLFDQAQMNQNGAFKFVYLQTRRAGGPNEVKATQARPITYQIQCQ